VQQRTRPPQRPFEADKARRPESLLSRLLVPIVVALVVGGSAPWWLTKVFDGTAASPGPVHSAGGPTAAPPVTQTGGNLPPPTDVGDLVNCVLEITFPFVSLRESPTFKSPEISSVPPGSYSSSQTSVVDFAGQDQRWFRITVGDRTGWVVYDSIQIASKSAGCP
jgi:hypothetical protein